MDTLNLLATAAAMRSAGVGIVPIDHKTKRPAWRLLPKGEGGKPTWKPYQECIASEDELAGWFKSGVQAIAAVGGAVSGGLLALDFDEPAFFDKWRDAVGGIPEGVFLQRTGGGGYQLWFRCERPGGNTKLAWVPNEAEESGRSAAIETRGEAGYAIIAPSLHPTGNRYERLSGDAANLPTIPQEDVEKFLAAARSLDQAPHTRQELEAQARLAHKQSNASQNGQADVIGEFNKKHSIESMLEAAGYKEHGNGRLIRPGGKNGTVSVKDGRSCHWAANDPLNNDTNGTGCGVHDAFDVWAFFNHGGDTKAAVKAAAEMLGMKYEPKKKKKRRLSGDGEEFTQAAGLVKLAGEADLFHDGTTPYATVNVNAHRETHAVEGTFFRRHLSAAFYAKYKKPPNAAAIADALSVLSGKALFDGEERRVFVRLAGTGGNIYLDLCDAGWRVVEITAAGWRIINAADAPVRFTRKKGMLPLPDPTRGGSILDLRPLINAGDNDAWVLIIAWVIGAFRASGPYCILVFEAEQGAGKSTLAEFLRQLIDPNEANLRAAPRDERDLVIAATNSRILSFDNLSGLSASLSDALCRLATGGGFSTRTLYSDAEETIFNVARPALLNGIDELAARPDLLERAAVVKLPSVSESGRRSKLDLETEFQRVRPGVLGALLDAVAAALKNEPSIKPAKLFRMADFQKWVMAAEPALPWKAGQFVDAYQRNRNEANSVAAESSAIGPAVMALIESRMDWSGTAADLIGLLDSDSFTAHRTRNRVDWPKSPRAMANALRRIAPSLRALGVTVLMGPGIREAHTGRRIIRIEKSGIASSPSSPESPDEAKNPHHVTENRDSKGDDARKSASSPSSPIVTLASPDPGASSPLRHPSSPENAAGASEMQNGDDGDDGDARKLALVESRERGEL